MGRSKPQASYLQLVYADGERFSPENGVDERPIATDQFELFGDVRKGFLVFVSPEALDSEILKKISRDLKPEFIADLRLFPSFDFPGMTRKSAFHEFKSNFITYFDATGIIGAMDFDDWRMKPSVLCGYISQALKNNAIGSSGPYVFILPSSDDSDQYVRIISRDLKPRPSGGWKIYRLDHI